jgi:ankyrin repeat protein
MFSIGAKVQTHSLTATEYNGLEGVVTGAAVEKNGVTRVPVRLELSNGEQEGMNLQPKNLLITAPTLNLELQKKLIKAVVDGSVTAIQKYVKLGADVNIPFGKDGSTPVFLAAAYNQVGVIRALAKYGVELNISNDIGITPVNVAAQRGHVDVIRALAEHGADLNTSNNNGFTPACIAAQEGQGDVINALAEHGADLNTPMNNGATPAFLAAQEGQVDVIRALAEHGADLNTSNNNGFTPA